MKVIMKGILPFQEKNFFFPIREKADYVRLILNTIQYLLIEKELEDLDLDECQSQLRVVVDKMSRVFLYRNGKYFSVSFPFIILLDSNNDIEEITTYEGIKIDSQNVSFANSILNDGSFQLNQSLVDFYLESTAFESTGLDLLEKIFHSEPAYIRYDHDPQREDGKLHPLDHLDVNYSSYGTYKIGLNNIITEDYFENLINLNTDCSFLED